MPKVRIFLSRLLIALMGLVQLSLFLAVCDVKHNWVALGFGSAWLYGLTAVLVVIAAVDFAGLSSMARAGLVLFFMGVVTSMAFAAYFANQGTASSPVLQTLRVLAPVCLLLVPTGFYVLFYGTLRRVFPLEKWAWGSAAVSAGFWLISFVLQLGVPVSDLEMSNQMVVGGLMLTSAVVGVAAVFVERARYR